MEVCATLFPVEIGDNAPLVKMIDRDRPGVTKGASDLLSFWLLHPRGRLEKMDRPTINLLKLLPNELIANILAMLHHRDLASCSRVQLPSFLSYCYD